MKPVAAILFGLLAVGSLVAQETAAPEAVTEGRYLILKPCDEAMDRGRRGEARDCYSRLLNGPGRSLVKAEAAWVLQDMHRANDMFRDAVARRPKDPYVRVRWGYLYLDTHSPAEAAKLFNEALSIDENYAPAKVGAATVLAKRFEGKAHDLVEEALEADPKLVDAYVLLAGMFVLLSGKMCEVIWRGVRSCLAFFVRLSDIGVCC